MKKLLSTAVMLLVALVSRGQTSGVDNALVVTLPDSGMVAWQHIGQVLVVQGFVVTNYSPSLGTVTACQPGLTHPNLLLTGSLHGRVLVLRGYTGGNNYDILLAQGTPVTLVDKEHGTLAVAWKQLLAVATALHGEIKHTRYP